MLTELKAYLMAHPSVRLTDVAVHFAVSPETARALLEHWVRKGKVARLDVAGQCRACDSPCSEGPEVYYQWLDRETGNA